jgi:hypothetical protein
MPRRDHMPGWKVVAIASPALAVVFPLFHGISFGFEPRAMLWLAAAGAALGVIGAPVIEPKAFRNPVAWQVFFSVLSCVFIAIQQQAGKLGFTIALVGGVVIGLTAKWWVDGLP